LKARIKREHAEVFKDLKRSAKVYGLTDVKKMDYGYSAKVKWMNVEMDVFAFVRGDQVKIVEENGKFSVTVDLREEAEVRVDCPSISSVVFKPMEWKIARNLEKYSSFISKAEVMKKERRTPILDVKTSRKLDLRGVTCPVPEIETKKAIVSAKPFEVIEVLVDNPPAIRYTLPEVARCFNCKYEVEDDGDYARFTFICGRNELEDLGEVRDLVRDERGIGRLYVYYDQVDERKVDSFDPSLLQVEGDMMVVASPEGRGWLLTAIVRDGRVVAARLDYGDTKLFDEDAINMVSGSVGIIHVFYMRRRNEN